MTKDVKYYCEKLRRLRNAANDLLMEMEENLKEDQPSPKQRQPLKQKRKEEFEENFVAGRWRKPKALRKAS